jgi:phosphatidylglycerol:prolipoprotein diacylglycerol transferase
MADPIYALIMTAAIVTGVIISRRTQSPLPLSRREKFYIGLGAFCGAMIGAKLPFVLSDWDGFLSGAAWFSNGKTILCGLVGGYFGVEIAKSLLGVRIKTGDSFAVPVAAAVGTGRLGCFHAGCCYGTPTALPWGVVFPNVDAVPRHPTQLYETAFHLTAAAALYWFWKRGKFRGQLIKLYILCYLVYRFFTELIRPEAHLTAGLTGYQWAALVLSGLFVWLWIRDAKAASVLEPSSFGRPVVSPVEPGQGEGALEL